MPTASPLLNEHPTGLRILRKAEVLDRVAFSDQQLFNLENRGEFPRRVQTGRRSVGWLEHEVDAWIAARMCERDNAAKAEADRIARMPAAIRHKWRMEHEGSDDVPA